jgi:hypothetical protein
MSKNTYFNQKKPQRIVGIIYKKLLIRKIKRRGDNNFSVMNGKAGEPAHNEGLAISKSF